MACRGCCATRPQAQTFLCSFPQVTGGSDKQGWAQGQPRACAADLGYLLGGIPLLPDCSGSSGSGLGQAVISTKHLWVTGQETGSNLPTQVSLASTQAALGSLGSGAAGHGPHCWRTGSQAQTALAHILLLVWFFFGSIQPCTAQTLNMGVYSTVSSVHTRTRE